MPELRRDPIIGQWVLIHTQDSLGPGGYEKEDQTPVHAATCPFCPGREHQTPPEVDSVRSRDGAPNAAGWMARVVSNKFPALKIEGQFNEQKTGLYHSSNGIGAHEVLIETPVHGRNLADFTTEETANVILLYQRRLRDLAGDQRFKYIVIFKNYGESAGTSVEHAHSQIIALPMIPKYVLEELEGASAYCELNGRCVFCDIIDQEYQDGNRIIEQNDYFIAFCPFVSRYEFEYSIMPKAHSSRFAEMDEPERWALADILQKTLACLRGCLSDPSYNYYLHVPPVNMPDRQDFHWHMEIVPGLTRVTGFELGTGFYDVRTSPEAAADYLKRARGPAGV